MRFGVSLLKMLCFSDLYSWVSLDVALVGVLVFFPSGMLLVFLHNFDVF